MTAETLKKIEDTYNFDAGEYRNAYNNWMYYEYKEKDYKEADYWNKRMKRIDKSMEGMLAIIHILGFDMIEDPREKDHWIIVTK
jgi:hypothetical protein